MILFAKNAASFMGEIPVLYSKGEHYERELSGSG